MRHGTRQSSDTGTGSVDGGIVALRSPAGQCVHLPMSMHMLLVPAADLLPAKKAQELRTARWVNLTQRIPCACRYRSIGRRTPSRDLPSLPASCVQSRLLLWIHLRRLLSQLQPRTMLTAPNLPRGSTSKRSVRRNKEQCPARASHYPANVSCKPGRDANVEECPVRCACVRRHMQGVCGKI